MAYRSSRHSPTISHLAYADDVLVFSQAAPPALRKLRECLDSYTAASGQQVNLGKSSFYIAEGHDEWANTIQEVGGFARGTFPFMYLGVPFYRGAKRTDLFIFLREKIAKRIQGWAHKHLSFGGRLTLIKSTLKALPLHIFQTMEPTAGAIKLLEQQLARFFWGSSMDRKRTHWIGWDQICRPIAEGGLGIRKFEEMTKAFSLKLWWRFREQKSLWAIHLAKKYCATTSPLTLSPPSRSSPTWKRLTRTWLRAQPLIRWVIGDGSTFFWDDIWVGNSTLRSLSFDDRGPPTARVADLWEEGRWSRPKLQLLHDQAGLPQAAIEEIMEVPIVAGEQDTPRWTLTPHGNFSVASAWEVGRHHRPTVPLLEEFWNKSLTASMSIFLWRLVSNRLPVDSKLQWRHISLASKCSCCPSQPDCETLHHLFVSGRGCWEVWREFDGWFPGGNVRLDREDSIPDRIRKWGQRMEDPDKSHISNLVPCLAMWFIWAERNNSRHKGEKFRPNNVAWQVTMHLQKLAKNGVIGPRHWAGCSLPVELSANPDRTIPRHLPILVKWLPPEDPWVKMNVAGVFVEDLGEGRGGGLIRDSKGFLIKAFSAKFKAASHREVMLNAIDRGLAVAISINRPTIVEIDSRPLVALLEAGSFGPADTRMAVARIRNTRRSLKSKFVFIRKVGNKPAQALANNPQEQNDLSVFYYRNATREVVAMVRLDQIGLPNFSHEDEDPD